MAPNTSSQQSCCFLEPPDYCTSANHYHEEFVITLLNARSTRSKLTPLELIQLAPNCVLDKALSEHEHLIQLQDGKDSQDPVFFQPQKKVWSKWSKSLRLFLKQNFRCSNPAPKLVHSEILQMFNNAIFKSLSNSISSKAILKLYQRN